MKRETYVVYKDEKKRPKESTRNRIEKYEPSIDNGDWKKINMHFACQTLKKWKSKSIIFYNNQVPQILKEISHIDFTQLRVLSLSKNNIQSVEPLAWLQTPILMQIYLNDNRIMSVKSFRKMYFPKSYNITIMNNFINDFQHLSQFKFQQYLERCVFQLWESDASIDRCSWLHKLEAKIIQKPSVLHKNHLSESRSCSMLLKSHEYKWKQKYQRK